MKTKKSEQMRRLISSMGSKKMPKKAKPKNKVEVIPEMEAKVEAEAKMEAMKKVIVERSE